MPTVLRIDGLRVVIYPNDHRPAHVHVKGADGEAVFILHCTDGPPELRESYGFKLPALGGIKDALQAALAALCAEWSAIHGSRSEGHTSAFQSHMRTSYADLCLKKKNYYYTMT